MTAAQTAQALGLDANAIAAFTGSKEEFAQHFGVDATEAPGPSGPTAAPNQPASATLVVRSATDWTVTWTAPAAGEPVDGYRVQFTPKGGSLTTQEVGNVLTYTGTADLGNTGQNVVVYVRAFNAAGQSAGAQTAPVVLP